MTLLFFQQLISTATTWLSLITLADALEITFFVAAFRTVSLMVYKQKNKQLLLGWYAYTGTFLVAYVVSFHAIMALTVVLLPAALALGIILHEKRFQQALVSYDRIDAVQAIGASGNWVDELMSFLLQRINQCYDVQVLLEQRNLLSTCLVTDNRIDARCSRKTLELLHGPVFHKDDILWITTQPLIISAAARWRQSSAGFIEHAAHVSMTLDCIGIRACSTTRRFTVIVQGKIIENLSAHHTLNLLQELCGVHRVAVKGDIHVTPPHAEHTQRPHQPHIS